MKTPSIQETEQLLNAIKNRQTELESLTSHMMSIQANKELLDSSPLSKEAVSEWLNALENISSLNSSISKAI
jgi:hypothetical protein